MNLDQVNTALEEPQENQNSRNQNQEVDHVDTGMSGIHREFRGYEKAGHGNSINDETPLGFFVDKSGQAYVKRSRARMTGESEISSIEDNIDLAEGQFGPIVGELVTDRESGSNQYSQTELERALRTSDTDTRYDPDSGAFMYDAAPQDGEAI